MFRCYGGPPGHTVRSCIPPPPPSRPLLCRARSNAGTAAEVYKQPSNARLGQCPINPPVPPSRCGWRVPAFVCWSRPPGAATARCPCGGVQAGSRRTAGEQNTGGAAALCILVPAPPASLLLSGLLFGARKESLENKETAEKAKKAPSRSGAGLFVCPFRVRYPLVRVVCPPLPSPRRAELAEASVGSFLRTDG